MKRFCLSLIVAISASTPGLAGTQPFIGEIVFTPVSYCPRNFVQASGQALPVNQNQALYSLVTNTYGGDTQKFNLPNVKPIYDANGNTLIPCIALTGAYPARN